MAGWEPYVAIVTVQALSSWMMILSKAAFDGGMSTYVFVFYRQAIAALVFVPFAISNVMKTSPPSLSPKLLIKIFMLAFVGLTVMLNVLSIGIKNTSATVASASSNSVPVFTFLLAVLIGMETVKLNSLPGMTKIIGVALCICGVLIIAFYEGPQLKPLNIFRPILHRSHDSNHRNSKSHEAWIVGTFLMISSTVVYSVYIVFQGLILREYPSALLFMTLSSLFSMVQSFLVAIAAERQISRWKLHWDEGLLAVAYNGVFVAGITLYLQAWCNRKKGPVFVAMFFPLALVITIACSSLLLGEVIMLGSVLGAALMVGGLYMVLWGKRRELKEVTRKASTIEEGSNTELVACTTQEILENTTQSVMRTDTTGEDQPMQLLMNVTPHSQDNQVQGQMN